MEIHVNSISEAWEMSIKELLRDNVPYVYTQRGIRAKEIIGMQLLIENPLSEPIISEHYMLGEMFVEKYCKSIIESTCGEQSIHSRIIKTKSISKKNNNQINRVVNLLRKEPNSRRAVISLWDPEYDMNSEHPPCACIIQFMIRNAKLDVSAYFRSNDSWMAVLPDMIAITKLSLLVSEKLKVPVGQYIHFCASYHLYEPDVVPALICFGGEK